MEKAKAFTNIIIVSEINPNNKMYNSTDIRVLSLGKILQNTYNVYVKTPSSYFELSIINEKEIFIQIREPRHALRTIVIVQLTRWAITYIEQSYMVQYRYIIDFYCPRILENLLVDTSLRKTDWEILINYEFEKYLIKRALQIGGGFTVANSRQRDWVLGLMTMNSSILHRKNLRDMPGNFVAVVPMTFYKLRNPSRSAARKYLSNLVKFDIADKFVVVWSGGWHEWMDVKTVVQAMKIIIKSHSDIILIMGARAKYNNINKLRQELIWESDLSELQQENHIIILESWIPYGKHINLVRAADVSLAISRKHIEDHFSYRTRAIESIQNGVPVIVNKENPILDEQHQNVFSVAPQNPAELALCIRNIYEIQKLDDHINQNIVDDQEISNNEHDLYRLIDIVQKIPMRKLAKATIMKGRFIDTIRRITRAYIYVSDNFLTWINKSTYRTRANIHTNRSEL